jgi:quercetin dioxygenase-like cupin family protein
MASHPGKTLVTVKSGTFTVYHARDCEPMLYGPGDAFVELPSTVHVGRNETGGVVELGVVFFGVPIGGSPRIDQPQPAGCGIT